MSEKSTKMVNKTTNDNSVDDQVKSTISTDMENVSSNNLNNLNNINSSTTSFNNSNINNSNLNNSNLNSNNITMNLNNHNLQTDSELINANQHSLANNLQTNLITNVNDSSVNENQILSNQINQLNLTTTTTLNIGNNLINGQNSIIQQSTNNLPPLNTIAASLPAANNLVNQANLQQIPNSSMMNNVATNQSVPNIVSANVELQDDSEDESEILEESPCGRWLKRREEVGFFIVFYFFF